MRQDLDCIDKVLVGVAEVVLLMMQVDGCRGEEMRLSGGVGEKLTMEVLVRLS